MTINPLDAVAGMASDALANIDKNKKVGTTALAEGKSIGGG